MSNDRQLLKILSDNTDTLKGLLILIVAVDHNDWFRRVAPDIFGPLTFHVLGFFLLAFSFGIRPVSFRFILDRVARYLVPFGWVLTLTSVVYSMAFLPEPDVWDRLTAWILSLTIGNAPFVKDSSGFLMLWFLPALFGLTCSLAFFSKPLSQGKNIRILIAIALLSHLLLPPLVGREILLWLPFGLGIAAEILILGLVWRYMLNTTLPKYWPIYSFLAYLVSFGALVYLRQRLEIATLDLYGINRPVLMLLQDISGISGVLLALWFAKLLRSVTWLQSIGKNSLLIYLFHAFPYILLMKLWPVKPAGSSGSFMLLLSGCATTAIAVVIAYAVAAFIYRSPTLSKWLVPRVWSDWPPARLFSLQHRSNHA